MIFIQQNMKDDNSRETSMQQQQQQWKLEEIETVTLVWFKAKVFLYDTIGRPDETKGYLPHRFILIHLPFHLFLSLLHGELWRRRWLSTIQYTYFILQLLIQIVKIVFLWKKCFFNHLIFKLLRLSKSLHNLIRIIVKIYCKGYTLIRSPLLNFIHCDIHHIIAIIL